MKTAAAKLRPLLNEDMSDVENYSTLGQDLGRKRKREEDEDEESHTIVKDPKLDDEEENDASSPSDAVTSGPQEEEDSSENEDTVDFLSQSDAVKPGNQEEEDSSDDEEECETFFEFFPPPEEDDRVYKIANITEMDEPTGDEYCKGMATWRVVGDLFLGFGMSAALLTSSSGIKFKRDKRSKQRPYDIPPELRRLITMFDHNRFPARDRNEFMAAINSLATAKRGWAHTNFALLMNDPQEYLNAILFLTEVDIVNDPVVHAKAARHLLELEE